MTPPPNARPIPVLTPRGAALSAALWGTVLLGTAACTAPATGHQASAAPRSSAPSPSRSRGTTATAGPVRPVTARTMRTHLPNPVSRATVFAGKGALLVAGGLGPGVPGSVLRLDPRKGSVHAVGRLPVPVHDAAGITLGRRHLILGGGAPQTLGTVQSLDAGGTATVLGQLPRPRSDLTACAVGGTGYVLGGYDGTRADPAVLATTDGRHFRTVARLPVPVRYPAAAALGADIYVFGGEHAGRATDTVQRIDVRTGTATVVGHLPQPLAHEAAATIGGTVYLLGGLAGHVPTARVLGFVPSRVAFVRAGSLPRPVSDAGKSVLGGVAYLVGGEVAVQGAGTGGTTSTSTVVAVGLSTSTAIRGAR